MPCPRRFKKVLLRKPRSFGAKGTLQQIPYDSGGISHLFRWDLLSRHHHHGTPHPWQSTHKHHLVKLSCSPDYSYTLFPNGGVTSQTLSEQGQPSPPQKALEDTALYRAPALRAIIFLFLFRLTSSVDWRLDCVPHHKWWHGGSMVSTIASQQEG